MNKIAAEHLHVAFGAIAANSGHHNYYFVRVFLVVGEGVGAVELVGPVPVDGHGATVSHLQDLSIILDLRVEVWLDPP